MGVEREDRRELDLARYLDGRMDEAERARFEAELEESGSLRAELEVALRVEDSLRRRFGEFERLELRGGERGERGVAGRIGRRVRLWPVLGAVAAAAAIVLGVSVWQRVGPPGFMRGAGGGGAKLVWAEDQYELRARGGWRINWTCEDAEEFARYTEEEFGEAVVVDDGGEGVRVAGWLSYGLGAERMGLGEEAGALLAWVSGEPVMVFIDPEGGERSLRVEGGRGLRVFRRDLGRLSLYELTPLDEARVLERFEAAPESLLGDGER